MVQDRVRLTNRITAGLKEYFPQVLGRFKDKDAAVFAEFLRRWPTLERAKRAEPGKLVDFSRTHNVRRWSCPTFLRQTSVEWAAQTIPRSYWAKAFYACCRARGKHHQAALRALAFKWIRILYRCWVERKPSDESRYLMSCVFRPS